MSNLPEEMFVQCIRKLNCDAYSSSLSAINPEPIFGSEMQEQRYVRADLHEDLKAENEKLREAVDDVPRPSVSDNSNLVKRLCDWQFKHAETISKCGGE